MKRLIYFIGIVLALALPPFQPVTYAYAPSPASIVTPKPPIAVPAIVPVMPVEVPEPLPKLEPVYVAPEPTQTAYTARTYGVSGNYAKDYIYQHESGNDPTKYNSSGCLGIGQACPASKLLAVCPTMDYACEDGFFTQYANDRYGGWEGAYNFWVNNHWW